MRNVRRLTAAVFVCAMSSSAFGADAAPGDSAKAQYEAERARCMSGSTGQDQASCLRSAGAAYDAIKQNRLQDPSTSFRENALARCKTLPASDRADCESRVDGAGKSSGSVKGGGVYKETVTTTVGPGTSNPATTPTSPGSPAAPPPK